MRSNPTRDKMKKISLPKIRKKKEAGLPARITNDTVAEHREQVLAGGRKFKYPIQYARHKLVINALIVTLVAVATLLAVAWWQLYLMQNSSTFFYRITKIAPVPVAVVDGEFVRYSDYLVKYRGSEYWMGKNSDLRPESEDGKRQLEYTKRQSINKAIEEAYAKKLARENNIVITESDVDRAIVSQRTTATGDIPQETFDTSMRVSYGWSNDDYRGVLRDGILTSHVAFAIDKKAHEQSEKAATLLKTNSDFSQVAESLGGEGEAKVTSGNSGMVNKTSKYSGLKVSEIAKMERGKISKVIRSDSLDGYYFVRVTAQNDTQVSFDYLHIPLTEFKSRVAKLKADGKIQEYINIAEQEVEQ